MIGGGTSQDIDNGLDLAVEGISNLVLIGEFACMRDRVWLHHH